MLNPLKRDVFHLQGGKLRRGKGFFGNLLNGLKKVGETVYNVAKPVVAPVISSVVQPLAQNWLKTKLVGQAGGKRKRGTRGRGFMSNLLAKTRDRMVAEGKPISGLSLGEQLRQVGKTILGVGRRKKYKTKTKTRKTKTGGKKRVGRPRKVGRPSKAAKSARRSYRKTKTKGGKKTRKARTVRRKKGGVKARPRRGKGTFGSILGALLPF